MQNVQPRATLRDIARRAGYHYSTVSLALREHPRIPAATRDRIRKIADALGYRPDAALSALCAYREQKLPAHRQSVIAWLTNHRTPAQWQRSACNRDYFAGASLRAAERGYTIECFWLAEPGMTGRRMTQILWTRGIQGILLPPQERICSIDLDWDKLSAVTVGCHLWIHPDSAETQPSFESRLQDDGHSFRRVAATKISSSRSGQSPRSRRAGRPQLACRLSCGREQGLLREPVGAPDYGAVER